MRDQLAASYTDSLNLLTQFIQDPATLETTVRTAEALAEVFRNGNKVLAAGNGGSACDAMHFCEEFTGRFQKNRPALPAISLTDSSHITCVGNDFGFDAIFSRGVEAFGQTGDFFLGLSTSGNSPNIIKAVEAARAKGLTILLMLGKDGGKLAGQGDFEFIVPGTTSDRIQEIHMIVLHIIIEGVERILFPENY